MAEPAPFGVRVDAPARLQMGLLDLRGDLGRLFGGIGAALAEPRTVVEVEPAASLSVEGDEAARAEAFGRRFLDHHRLRAGAHVRVRRAIPAHAGLGSGTQLALAVASGLAAMNGLPADVRSLVTATGRGARSGVGSWTFERGGLVVDGGRKVRELGGAPGVPAAAGDGATLAPLLVRYPLPPAWRCVVVTPVSRGGPSGEDEREAFARLPLPAPEVVWRMCHLVLIGMLPAVVERDLAAFGKALAELQQLVGECFAPVQGSTYAGPASAELVRRLAEAGAHGAGQSSWGPSVYALVEGEEVAGVLAARAAEWVAPGGRAFATAFDNRGAALTRLQGTGPCPESP